MKVAGVASIYKLSFERFRQPKSVKDEKKSVDNAVPKSTPYEIKWSCKVFEE